MSAQIDDGGPAFRPCPGHYTRENWLAYRVIAQLSESGLDINTSPAVQVWDVAHREIIAWMKEHGIKTGLRPNESTPDSIPADVRGAIYEAWEKAFEAYCNDCGGLSAHQAAGRSLLKSLAPFFAAKDAELAEENKRFADSCRQELIDLRAEVANLEPQLAEAQRMTSEINASQIRWIEKCAEEVARAEAAEQQLAEAKKDSVRLDWLGRLAEVRVETDDGEGPTPPEWHVRGSLTGQSGISRESLRAAIDAAMQQEGQQ